MSKPIDLIQVIDKIEKYVNAASSNTFTNTVIALMEASGLGKETSEKIVEEFCGQAVRLMCSIRENISANNLEEAGILLHQLKGSAGNVRATEIAKQALEAEYSMSMIDPKMLGILLARIEELLADLLEKPREE